VKRKKRLHVAPHVTPHSLLHSFAVCCLSSEIYVTVTETYAFLHDYHLFNLMFVSTDENFQPHISFLSIDLVSRRWLSSGMLRPATCQKFTDVSDVPAASTIRSTRHAQHSRRQSSHSHRRENLKSHRFIIFSYLWTVWNTKQLSISAITINGNRRGRTAVEKH
jgi:hypothetical protein